MLYLPLLLQLHGLATAGEDSLAAFGDNHLRAALSALISLARLIGHFPSASITFQPQSSASWVVFQDMWGDHECPVGRAAFAAFCASARKRSIPTSVRGWRSMLMSTL